VSYEGGNPPPAFNQQVATGSPQPYAQQPVTPAVVNTMQMGKDGVPVTNTTAVAVDSGYGPTAPRITNLPLAPAAQDAQPSQAGKESDRWLPRLFR
jgi:hypothetical protein